MAYKTVSPVKNDGVYYKAGEAIVLHSESEAKRLLALGVIVEADPTEKVKEVKHAPAEIKSETPNMEWTKQRLLGLARSKGLELDKTLTKQEILDAIQNAPETPVEPEQPKSDETPQE